LFPRGSRSTMVLENELTRKGYKVISPVLYETNPCPTLDESAKQIIYAREASCIAFTSPSSVMSLKSLMGEEDFNSLLKGVTIAAIGPATSKACADAGLSVKIQPASYTLQSMARAIVRHYGCSMSTLKYQPA